MSSPPSRTPLRGPRCQARLAGPSPSSSSPIFTSGKTLPFSHYWTQPEIPLPPSHTLFFQCLCYVFRATVQPGMICIARKKRTAVFRQYVAAETAVPVIACAACLGHGQEKNYFFAGVARSKSVREADDGIGERLSMALFNAIRFAMVLYTRSHPLSFLRVQARRPTSSSPCPLEAWSPFSTRRASPFTR